MKGEFVQFTKIGIASDHSGKEMRKTLLNFLTSAEIEIVDYGVQAENGNSVDYPDYAEILASGLVKGEYDGAIAICGTGIGMCITANKFPRVRATSVWDEYSARMSREHNDSNCICIGARTLNLHRTVDLISIWLNTPFLGDRHQMRLNKIREIEKKNFKLR